MFNVFEQPWTLLVVAAIALCAVLVVRAACPDKHRWWLWLAPAFLASAAFGLDALVKTDLEKINRVITTGVKGVEEENPDAIEAIIAENYSDSYHRTKKTLMYHCRARLAEPLVEKAISRIVRIDITGTKAAVVFTVRIVFDKQSYIYQDFRRIMLTKVKLNLQKQTDKKWLIDRAELLEIDRRPVNWRDIR